MAKLRSIPVIALCAIYIFLAAGVALLSSSAYQAVERASGENSQGRVALSYVISQLRAGDTVDGIRMLQYGDGIALGIADGENKDYETLLYCHDGALMEMFAERDLGLEPSAGMKIVAISSIEIGMTNNLLHICIVDANGNVSQTNYFVQSGEVAA